MISPAILACAPSGGGPVPYHADAVHFDGATWLDIASLTATDGFVFSQVIWFKASPQVTLLLTCDPSGNFTTNSDFGTPNADTLDLECANASGTHYFKSYTTSPCLDDAWHCVIFSVNTNFDAGLKKAKVYLDDVDVTGIFQDAPPAFAMAFNGLPLFLFTDSFGDNFIGDAADYRCMPGVSLLDGSFDIPLATRRLFIDADGKPVDPSVATDALGAPCMLFSGNASAFGTNQGTGGAFTTTGTLTNASTSPSD